MTIESEGDAEIDAGWPRESGVWEMAGREVIYLLIREPGSRKRETRGTPHAFCQLGQGSSNRIAAIDTNGSAGYKIRGMGGQVDGGSGNLFGVPPSPGGGAGKNFVVEWHGLDGSRHVGLNPSWRNCVDLNVVRRKFDCHRLGQLNDRAFRGAVRGDQAGSEERVHAADVDDLPAITTAHGVCGELGEKKDSIELRLDHVV